MKEFDEFVSLWKEETKSIKIKKIYEHMLFLVVCPDKLKWDFGIEKQIQTTTFMMSGGDTGAGTGHDVQFCYRSEVYDLLLKCNHTHAMIVSVGMVFDMVGFGGRNRVTSITDFYNFVKSGKFCKSHIIAKPNQQTFFHHQHMNLNLTVWKDFGAPDMSKKYDLIKRSDDNFHDDYTPSWADVKSLPTVINFTNEERRRKSFSYYKNNQSKFWRKIRTFDTDSTGYMEDYYFSRFMTRIRKQFYVENTENFPDKLPDEKFDVIFSTTAGYRAALLADKLKFDGEIVLFDYCQENLDIKQMIIEMNMSLEEINSYRKTLNHNMVTPDSISKQDIESMGSQKKLMELEEKMFNNCDIEYWLMDLISPDYDKLLNKINGKTVFFDASNIFGYHMSHAYYTLNELVSSYKKLHNVLGQSNKTYYRGTSPTKQQKRLWI